MINRDLIRQARQADLVEYLTGRGEHLKKEHSGRYRHAEHNSLLFSCEKPGGPHNAFYWNSRNEKGNSIDFLMLFYGMDFKTALAELTNTNLDTKKELAPVPQPKQVPVSDNFVLPDLNKDMRRTFAYLIKTRFIESSIVQFLAKEKLLMQDQRGNAVFPWVNEKGEIVGAELQGTLDRVRFKGIVAGSAYGYSYNVSIGSPKRLCAFESAIDLLSFWSVYKDIQDVLLVSMAGLKEEVIEGFLKRSTSSLNVFLCVDNDGAGKTFIKGVQAHIKAQELLPQTGKDWNEYLKLQTKRRL